MIIISACLTLMFVAMPVEFPADEILATLKTSSVHRHKVKWDEIEPAVRAKLAKATTDDEKAKAIVSVLEKMNDVHSSLMHQGKYYAHYEGVDAATHKRLKPIMERQRAEAGKVTTQFLSGAFSYVRVPSMYIGTDKIESAANDLASKVLALGEQKPQGWIIDLRTNGGGNLYPMLLGLQPLLGNEVVGGTVGADNKQLHQWVLKSDGMYWRGTEGDRRFAGLGHAAVVIDDKAPVVVLVGPITMSSGQATALAFKHRPNTLLLGEPTAKGYCTVNQPINLGKETMLNLAVGYMADRKGTAYESVVLPEQTVEGGDSFDALMDDRKVLAAIKWLKEKGK